jgi:F0F1-type ATP synthase assembly protein I
MRRVCRSTEREIYSQPKFRLFKGYGMYTVKEIIRFVVLGSLLGALLGWLGDVSNIGDISVNSQFGLLVGLMLGGLVSLLIIEAKKGNAVKQTLLKIIVFYGSTVLAVSIAISQGIVAGTLVGGFLGIFLGTLWVLLPEWFD